MYPMQHPWDERCIYLHENHKKSSIHVGNHHITLGGGFK